MTHRLRVSLLITSLLIVAAGCGSKGPARFAVSGTVAYKGEALKSGAIQFEPLETGQGSAGGAPIVDGQYTIPAERGLAEGNYRVRIYSGTTGEAPKEPPGPGVPIAAERIPVRYNVNSELKASIRAGADNTFDYQLD